MIKEPYSDYRSESGLVFVPFLFAVLMESIGFVLWSRSCHFFLPFTVGAGTYWNVKSRTGHLSNSSRFGKSRAETGIFLERPESRSRHFRNRNLFGASRAEAGIFLALKAVHPPFFVKVASSAGSGIFGRRKSEPTLSQSQHFSWIWLRSRSEVCQPRSPVSDKIFSCFHDDFSIIQAWANSIKTNLSIDIKEN